MTASSKTPTLHNWLFEATSQLQTAKIDSARLDSELLACFVLNKPRTWLHAHSEYQLTESAHQQLRTLLQRRLDHEPIAYITGQREFYGRQFIITPDVLVPRPESEYCIELILKISEHNLQFIDVGTGSGILAITIALEQPTWSGTAIDVSPEALKVAQKNAKNLGVKNIVFKQQNLLSDDHNHYDVVVANLPYVPKNMHNKPDLAHEPNIALFADHSGLALYEELFQQLAHRPQKPTHVLTESLLTQHAALKKLAHTAGYTLEQTQGLIQHFVPS